ncbi:hypothetical protein T492DRAFT_1044517 [Pavlovales sp. CCMP2436]|nr:hypothetical protein T492DRAFT_1044517 [Pavlovales sp. CCMP2436]
MLGDEAAVAAAERRLHVCQLLRQLLRGEAVDQGAALFALVVRGGQREQQCAHRSDARREGGEQSGTRHRDAPTLLALLLGSVSVRGEKGLERVHLPLLRLRLLPRLRAVGAQRLGRRELGACEKRTEKRSVTRGGECERECAVPLLAHMRHVEVRLGPARRLVRGGEGVGGGEVERARLGVGLRARAEELCPLLPRCRRLERLRVEPDGRLLVARAQRRARTLAQRLECEEAFALVAHDGGHGLLGTRGRLVRLRAGCVQLCLGRRQLGGEAHCLCTFARDFRSAPVHFCLRLLQHGPAFLQLCLQPRQLFVRFDEPRRCPPQGLSPTASARRARGKRAAIERAGARAIRQLARRVTHREAEQACEHLGRVGRAAQPLLELGRAQPALLLQHAHQVVGPADSRELLLREPERRLLRLELLQRRSIVDCRAGRCEPRAQRVKLRAVGGRGQRDALVGQRRGEPVEARVGGVESAAALTALALARTILAGPQPCLHRVRAGGHRRSPNPCLSAQLRVLTCGWPR